MSYRVTFTSKSLLEFHDSALWWAENRDAEQAELWVKEFEVAINHLAEHPERNAAIHEQNQFAWKYTYRRILFGLGRKPTHRAIYRIHGDTVYVVSIRHVSQNDIDPTILE